MIYQKLNYQHSLQFTTVPFLDWHIFVEYKIKFLGCESTRFTYWEQSGYSDVSEIFKIKKKCIKMLQTGLKR